MVKGKEEGKIWAFLGVFLTLIGFLIVLLAKKDDKYAMYYAKHGLVLGIIWIVLWILNLIPIIGWVIYVVGGILTLILWVIIFIAALSGEEKKFPVITELASKFKI
jgi:uncharacterized membrane protein